MWEHKLALEKIWPYYVGNWTNTKRSFFAEGRAVEFEKLTDDTSKLHMQVIYRSVACRDQNLKLPFAWGVNMAHNKLQDVVSKLK